MAPRNRKTQKKPVKTEKLQTQQGNRSVWVALGVIAVVLIVFGAVAAFNPSWNPSNNVATPTPSASPAPTKIPAAADPYAGATRVLLRTTMGDITVELRNDMPITTGNFINLVKHGTYNGSTFNRVVDGFMIQGGKPADNGLSDTTVPPIQDEFTTSNHNYNGTLSMANTGAANTGASQFFINVADNNYTVFDGKYVSFGRVVSGMDIVMAISHLPTDSSEAPTQAVLIIGAKVLS
jgi:peptidylprolyl isomerase